MSDETRSRSREILVPEPEAPRDQSIAVHTVNQIDPVQVNQLFRLAEVWVKSKLLPQHIETPQQALTIAMMGDALGVKWMTAIQHMYVVRGKVGCEAKLMLGLVQRSGLLQDFDLQGNERQATCTMRRRGYSKGRTEIVTRERADRARWSQEWKAKDPKDRSKGGEWVEKHNWRAMPEIMLQWRAIALNCRFLFPDVVLGMQTFDEIGVPLRVGTSGEVEIDAEEAAVLTEDAPARAVEPLQKQEPVYAPPTEEQKVKVMELLQLKHPDGAPVITPSEKRKLQAALLETQREEFYRQTIEVWQETCDQRLASRAAVVEAGDDR